MKNGTAEHIMRAAGGCLRLGGSSVYRTDQDLIHGDAEQDAQRVEVVDGGEGLPSLSFVDGAGRFKSKPVLQVSDAQASLLAKPCDVLSGRRSVDRRES